MIEISIIRDAFDIYSRHYHSLGDYSATTIIDSPRRVALFSRYGDRVEHTPESQAASLVGTAVHDKMEKLLTLANVKYPHYIVERSVVDSIEVFPGVHRLLGGKFDILADFNHLIDIKTCKTWKIIFDPDHIDWTKQLNIYRWLLNNRGYDVKDLTVCAFFLDWIASKRLQDKRYPKEPIMEFQIEVWPLDETTKFIMDRLQKHVECENMLDTVLPECTAEEMWEREPAFAIMKNKDAKRAMRVCRDCTLHDAIETAQSLKGVSRDSYIEIRYSQRKRCEEFCAVNEYCNQYKAYLQNQDEAGKRVDIFELGGVL